MLKERRAPLGSKHHAREYNFRLVPKAQRTPSPHTLDQYAELYLQHDQPHSRIPNFDYDRRRGGSRRRFIPFAVLKIYLAAIVCAKPVGSMITKAKVSDAERSARARKPGAHLRQTVPRLLTFAIRAKAGRTCHRIFRPSAVGQWLPLGEFQPYRAGGGSGCCSSA